MYPTAPDAGSNGFIEDGTSGNPSNRDKLRRIAESLGAQNKGTKTYLALRHAQAILGGTDAASKVIILMSDGESQDCCSFPMTADNDCRRNFNELDNGTPGSDDDYCQVTSGSCAPNPLSPIAVAGNPDCRFSHPDAALLKADGVAIFTVAYPQVISAMREWATQAPSGSSFSYSYAGPNVSTMLGSIIGSLGATIEVSGPSGSGITSGSTTVEEDRLTVPLTYTATNNSGRNYCADAGRQGSGALNVTVRFTPLDDDTDARVTLRNMRFNHCPLSEF
jgi:hypothetical protein